MNTQLVYNARRFTLQANRSLTVFKATQHTETGICCGHSHAPTRANCVIALSNQWSDFCRQLLIDSATGGKVTRNGIRLARASSLPLGADVIATLRSLYVRRPPYWEPNWTVSSDFITACANIGLANLADISAAIGAVGSPAEELRLTRNYVAHRNFSTASNAVSALNTYGVTLPLDIDTALVKIVSPATTLYERWVVGLTTIAFAAC